MHRSLSILIATSVLTGCALDPLGDSRTAGARKSPAAAGEPVALSRSLAIEDSRPAPAGAQQASNDDDPLSLKATPLHADLGIGDRAFREDQAGALNGDKDAALRVAQMFEKGSNSVPRDERRMLQWLHRASDLNNGSASYELYRYYLRRGLDRTAVRYEKRALEQGFVPPPRLDPRRG